MTAVFSTCNKYRYLLHRKISSPLRWVRTVTFFMLNPSTADAVKNDRTIAKCIKFAEREGYTDLYVVNLFALRSTDPKTLFKVKDPVGPENEKHINETLAKSDLVVAAWGNHRAIKKLSTVKISDKIRAETKCLRLNKNGSPRHPLYIPMDEHLKEFDLVSFFNKEINKSGRS